MLKQTKGKLKESRLYMDYCIRSGKSHDRNSPGVGREKAGTVYSFDIFDTLIRRKVLVPEGIFYYVKDRMAAGEVSYPNQLVQQYPQIRSWCESNAREYYTKTTDQRNTQATEIPMELIFERIQSLYGLSDEQTAQLMEWELEAEYDNCIPFEQNLALAEDLVKRGEQVCLISDMYLPEPYIRRLLGKVSDVLGDVPLFLSSSVGLQKSTGLLYDTALGEMGYDGSRTWIHYGDNRKADGSMAAGKGLHPVLHSVPSLEMYEKTMIEQIGTYDSVLVAAQIARMRMKLRDQKEFFAYAYISLYFVPYMNWVLEQACREGIQTLYFISRDGYHLKQAADELIQAKGLPLKTKYIYGSRRAWWIPSFIDRVDEEFFTTYCNFSGVNTFEKLLQALMLDEKQFDDFFPQLAGLRQMPNLYKKKMEEIIPVLKASEPYRDYLLELAARKRPAAEAYLAQEIDFKEKFAFAEYWGRGYTQTCHARLLRHMTGDPRLEVIYYYARSIYPTQGADIRKNFTCCSTSLVFVEAVFANIPYKSIEQYEEKQGRMVPVLEPADCDLQLHRAMNRYLPRFARWYAGMKPLDEERLNRDLFHFALTYYDEHKDTPEIAECYGSLIDSIGIHGRKREYAPVITRQMIRKMESGVSLSTLTSSVPMSKARSEKKMAERFAFLAETLPKLRESQAVAGAQAALEQKTFLDEMEKSHERLEGEKSDADYFRKMYEQCCRSRSLKKQLLFLHRGSCADTGMLFELFRSSAPAGWQVTEAESDGGTSPEQLACLLSESCVIAADDFPSLFAGLHLRKRTKVILLSRNGVLRVSEERKDPVPYSSRALEEMHNRIRIDAVVTAGEDQTPEDAFSGQRIAPVHMKGDPVTDLLFSEDFRKSAACKWRALTGNDGKTAGRRTVLYAGDGIEESGLLPDLSALADTWKESFLLVIKSGAPVYVPAGLKEHIITVGDEMTMRECLVCADVLAGELTDDFSESVLTGKPVFFTTGSPGISLPVARDGFDLVRALPGAGRNDSGRNKKLEEYREKAFGYCRGSSVQTFWKTVKEL